MKAFMVHNYGNEWYSISVYPAARRLKYFPKGLETGWCVSCRANIGNLAVRTETRGAKSIATFLFWLQRKKNPRWRGKKKKVRPNMQRTVDFRFSLSLCFRQPWMEFFVIWSKLFHRQEIKDINILSTHPHQCFSVISVQFHFMKCVEIAFSERVFGNPIVRASLTSSRASGQEIAEGRCYLLQFSSGTL